MSTGALARLLDPVAVDAFVADYCARRPLLIRGSAAKLDWLLDERRLRALLLDELPARGEQRCAIDALVPSRPNEPLTLMTRAPMAPCELDARLAAGQTVCITRLSDDDAALAACVEDVTGALGWTGSACVNCYVSPPGSGADMHWDAQITMSLQIAGRKRWRYAARPSLVWPRRPAQVDREGRVRYHAPLDPSAGPALQPAELGFEEVVLAPGDVLCLPAGTLHDAKAVETSIALNLALGRPALPARATGGAHRDAIGTAPR